MRRGPGRARRGMSIVEMMVVCVVFALLFGLVYKALVPGLDAWKRSEPRSQLQEHCLVAMGRITSDLRNTHIATVSLSTGAYADPETGETRDAHSLSLLTPLDGSGDVARDSHGRILWQKYLVYYLDRKTYTLRCHEEPLAATAEPPASLRCPSFTPDPAKDRIVARHIVSLSFSAERDEDEPGGDALLNPVSIFIRAREGEFATALRSSVATLVEVINPGGGM